MVSLEKSHWSVLKHVDFVLPARIMSYDHASIDRDGRVSHSYEFLIGIEAQIVDY